RSAPVARAVRARADSRRGRGPVLRPRDESTLPGLGRLPVGVRGEFPGDASRFRNDRPCPTDGTGAGRSILRSASDRARRFDRRSRGPRNGGGPARQGETVMKKPYVPPTVVRHEAGWINAQAQGQSYPSCSEIDGVPVTELLREFGSPVYVFSERTL